MSQNCPQKSPHYVPKTFPKLSPKPFKDLSMFDLKNGFYTKKTNPIRDLQTPGNEDLDQYERLVLCKCSLAFYNNVSFKNCPTNLPKASRTCPKTIPKISKKLPKAFPAKPPPNLPKNSPQPPPKKWKGKKNVLIWGSSSSKSDCTCCMFSYRFLKDSCS